MAASNNSAVFMSKVSRYVGNIAGTNAYWNKVREELKAIINNVGAPTLFFTFVVQICIGLNYMLCLEQFEQILVMPPVR